jgi:cell division protein FtsL
MKTNKKSRNNILTSRVVGVSFIFLSIFIVEFFLKTWCGVQCIRTGYEITNALTNRQNLICTQKNLQIELAHLKSPQVLGKIAKKRFGLTVPGPEQIIIMP